jgi:hypothetical protein
VTWIGEVAVTPAKASVDLDERRAHPRVDTTDALRARGESITALVGLMLADRDAGGCSAPSPPGCDDCSTAAR